MLPSPQPSVGSSPLLDPPLDPTSPLSPVLLLELPSLLLELPSLLLELPSLLPVVELESSLLAPAPVEELPVLLEPDVSAPVDVVDSPVLVVSVLVVEELELLPVVGSVGSATVSPPHAT